MPDQNHVSPEVLQKVRELVAQTLRLKVDEVGETSSLPNDLGAESIDILELRFLLEKSFRISITEKDMREVARGQSAADMAKNFTPRAIASEISRRLAATPPAS